jgi:hypothetical protein
LLVHYEFNLIVIPDRKRRHSIRLFFAAGGRESNLVPRRVPTQLNRIRNGLSR